MSEHSAEKVTCPLCHSPAYVCTEEHTDGPGARVHCRAASMHNFRLDDPRFRPGDQDTAGCAYFPSCGRNCDPPCSIRPANQDGEPR